MYGSSLAPPLNQIPPVTTPDQDPATMAASLIGCKDEDSNNSGSGGAHFLGEQEEAASVPRDYAAGAPPPPPFPHAGTPTPDTKLGPTSPAASSGTPGNSSSPSPKRSGGRRSVQKRVVSIPITDADGSRAKGCGEGAPPSDSWAWRKYGQKPIKGSPYPRGYYRCSSSKGCPARKQVERSRVDPNMLVVTYACEHNHPWPLPKNNAHHHHHHQQQHLPQQQPSPPAATSPPKPSPPDPDAPGALPPGPGAPLISSPASADLEESSFAADLLADVASLVMMPDEFGWFADVSTSSPPAEAFVGSAMMPMAMEDDMELSGGDAAGDEESSLFAGLGELPECAVVFRRVRMQMAAAEAPRGVAAAPCCGTTG